MERWTYKKAYRRVRIEGGPVAGHVIACLVMVFQAGRDVRGLFRREDT